MVNPEANQVNKSNLRRSKEAQDLHEHICKAAFISNEDVFTNKCKKLEKFLEGFDDVTRTNIIMEKAVVSDKNDGHTRNALMDALYLPVSSEESKKLLISDDKKAKRAIRLFTILSNSMDIGHCKKLLFDEGSSSFVDKYNFTLALYSILGTKKTDLIDGFYKKILEGVKPDKQQEFLRQQWTTITNADFSLLHSAVKTGNLELYQAVVARLDKLPRETDDENKAYAAQWTTITKDGFSLLHSAVITGNLELYQAVVAKLDELNKSGIITPETYAAQWTTVTKDGFTILHDSIEVYGKSSIKRLSDAREMLDDISSRLVKFFEDKTGDFKKFLEQRTKEDFPRILGNFINAAYQKNTAFLGHDNNDVGNIAYMLRIAYDAEDHNKQRNRMPLVRKDWQRRILQSTSLEQVPPCLKM